MALIWSRIIIFLESWCLSRGSGCVVSVYGSSVPVRSINTGTAVVPYLIVRQLTSKWVGSMNLWICTTWVSSEDRLVLVITELFTIPRFGSVRHGDRSEAQHCRCWMTDPNSTAGIIIRAEVTLGYMCGSEPNQSVRIPGAEEPGFRTVKRPHSYYFQVCTKNLKGFPTVQFGSTQFRRDRTEP